jgi:hypothetical protein
MPTAKYNRALRLYKSKWSTATLRALRKEQKQLQVLLDSNWDDMAADQQDIIAAIIAKACECRRGFIN